MKWLLTIIIVLFLALMGCKAPSTTSVPGDADVYAQEGTLTDVSGGSASGTVRATFEDGRYALIATFSNLPDPQGTDFYEGWIVKRTAGVPTSVISTGRAIKSGATYTNPFTSDQDLTDHDFYVLTLEPDDGDPAPAEHILEGTLQ